MLWNEIRERERALLAVMDMLNVVEGALSLSRSYAWGIF